MAYKYFKVSEFDSPDVPGSGSNMDSSVIEKLDQMREILGFSLRVNSGYRTKAYHDKLTAQGYETSKTSPHLKGKAADIGFTAGNVTKVIEAAIKVGFKRIGIISPTAIHVDLDESKPANSVWFYAKTPAFLKTADVKAKLIEAMKTSKEVAIDAAKGSVSIIGLVLFFGAITVGYKLLS